MKKWIICVLTIFTALSVLGASCQNNGADETGNPQETEREEVESKHYTYAEIVSYLYDMERLAELPKYGESSKEFTSYDRRSVYNEESGTYENWSANADGNGIIREEDGGSVIAEMEGPGYITRIWSAQVNGYGSGKIKIFIDGNETPVIDTTFQSLFRGSKKIFPYDSLSYMAARGLNCYVPITYNQSCKVVVYDKWGQYYHINYVTLPENATVESFTYPLSEENEAALKKADEYLSGDLSVIEAEEGDKEFEQTVTAKSGERTELFSTTGKGAIKGLQIQVEGLTGEFEDWQTLKELTLSMYWDNESEPSVWTPLEDFFGTTGGVNPYQSLPLGVTQDGVFYCRWYMPYNDGAKILVENDGSSDFKIKVRVVTEETDVENKMRFHAKWQRMEDAEDEDQRWPDSSVLSVNGRGRFLGMMLHNYKTSGEVDPDCREGFAWWGEGDEKFYIDGEKFPSWFGTGTEDYFGYAWCDPTLFDQAFHAQTYNKGGVNEEGNKVLCRYQIIDNIPFFESFQGYLEKYYGEDYVRYANVAYFYLESGAKDAIGASSLQERTDYYLYLPPEGTFFEGESLYIRSFSNGTLDTQGMKDFGDQWSNDSQLWWKPAKAGATLDIYVNLPEAGTYTIKGNFTMAGDYGIARFSYNGENIGEAMDFYATSVKATGEITIGTVSLPKGLSVLRVTVEGKNKLSSSFMLGLDYLSFEK